MLYEEIFNVNVPLLEWSVYGCFLSLDPSETTQWISYWKSNKQIKSNVYLSKEGIVETS